MTDHDILRPDRKKSAHWTENDTAILLDVLLRYKDTGRTQDNGFKPEVWKEAAERVKGTTTMGGPKTPEACKSRWQRRDFKAIKELETLPGFTFNRTTHKLQASSEAWAAADKTHEALKAHKIHLPQYDALTTLCPVDPASLCMLVRNKNRTSLGAMSDTSSLLSSMSSAGSVNPQTPQMGLAGMLNTPGMIPQVSMGVGLGDEMINWDAGEMENEPDLEGTFTMPDGSMITMPRAQKRMSTHFDNDDMAHGHMTAMLDGRTSPSKKQRLNHMHYPHHPQRQSSLPSQNMQYGMPLPPAPTNSPDQSVVGGHGHAHSQLDNAMGLTSPPQSLASAHLQAVTGLQPSHMAPHQHGHPPHHQHNQPQFQHQQHIPDPSHAHHHPEPQQVSHMAEQPAHQHPNHPDPPHGQFTTGQVNTTQTPHHVLSKTQTHPPPHVPPLQTHLQVQQPHSHTPKPHSPLRYPAPAHAPPGRPTPPLTERRESPAIPDNASDGSVKTELTAHRASLAPRAHLVPRQAHIPQTAQTSPKITASEGQRRMDAIILLQNQETEMKDEEMIEVVAEFEASVAAADTYLAIRRDGLRRLYLDKILKRRGVARR